MFSDVNMGKEPTACPVMLKPNERLASVRKEWHVRKQNGQYNVWIVEDRYFNHILIGQKLSSIVNGIKAIAGDESVSVAGMYHTIHRSGDRTNGYLHHRWKVQNYSLEEAPAIFNSMRSKYDNSTVIGEKGAYTICL